MYRPRNTDSPDLPLHRAGLPPRGIGIFSSCFKSGCFSKLEHFFGSIYNKSGTDMREISIYSMYSKMTTQALNCEHFSHFTYDKISILSQSWDSRGWGILTDIPTCPTMQAFTSQSLANAAFFQTLLLALKALRILLLISSHNVLLHTFIIIKNVNTMPFFLFIYFLMLIIMNDDYYSNIIQI